MQKVRHLAAPGRCTPGRGPRPQLTVPLGVPATRCQQRPARAACLKPETDTPAPETILPATAEWIDRSADMPLAAGRAVPTFISGAHARSSTFGFLTGLNETGPLIIHTE